MKNAVGVTFWKVSEPDTLSDGSKVYSVRLNREQAWTMRDVFIEVVSEKDAYTLCDVLNRMTYDVTIIPE